MYKKIRTIVYVLLLLITFAHGNYEVDELTCNNVEEKSMPLQLKKHLFCEYMEDVRPVQNHKNTTTVHFGIIPKFIEVDEMENIVNVHCWTMYLWNDDHLTWNPSHFGNLNRLDVVSSKLWIPDIVTYNFGNDDSEMPVTNCWISSEGEVKCVPTMVYTTRCHRDYTFWPYDAQNCTIQFGSWSHSNEELKIVLINHGLVMNGYQPNLEWDIEQAYITERIESSKFKINITSQSISIHFILKRHPNSLYAIFFTTIITLMVITLTTVWLDPKSVERMILAIVNFICHLLFLETLHWQIPGSAISSAVLLKFFEKSLGLACFTLILTSILRQLLELSTETPAWVATRTSGIVKSKLGRILLLSILDPKATAELEAEAEDNANLVSSKKNEVSWKHVAMLLSWINFFCILLAYIIILIIYLPTKSSAKSYNFNI